MKISIIIPVYNVEQYINRCITSILNQTMTEDVECIIINDCTPDKSMQIINNLLPQHNSNIQFKIINHTINQGLAAARNTGMENATGEYVIHIDSDDFCEPTMLEDMYNAAIQHNSDIVIADYWIQYPNKAIYVSQEIPQTKAERFRANLKDKIKGYNWNKLIRKELYTKHNITYIKDINYGEDFLIALQLFYYAEKVFHINKAYLHYIQYNSNSYSQSISRKSLDNIVFCERFLINFLTEKNILSSFEDEVNMIKLRNFNQLIFRSCGSLQKKWFQAYKGIPTSVIYQNPQLIPSTYWKIATYFAFKNMLSLYNFMRFFWRMLRPKLAQSVPLFNK